MKMCKRKFVALLMVAISMPMFADSEGGLILGLEAEKKVSKRMDISMEADMRTRNNFRTMDRWGIGIGASYKLISWLKADAGYKFLDYNFHENITYKPNGLYNHWRPSYWGVKHRFYAGLTGSYKFSNNIKLSLRERWQYTYRPKKTVTRWDFDEELWEDKVRTARGRNQLRSRFEISYDKKKALLTPFLSIETYHSWAIEKVRYTIGTDIRLTKHHSLNAFYRFQKMHNVDEDEYDPDKHYLGVGYKFKF